NCSLLCSFFSTSLSTADIHPLSLHDALPISSRSTSTPDESSISSSRPCQPATTGDAPSSTALVERSRLRTAPGDRAVCVTRTSAVPSSRHAPTASPYCLGTPPDRTTNG